MKQYLIPILFAVMVITNGCQSINHLDEQSLATATVGPDGFTGTQRYQIMSWTIKSYENYSHDEYRCSAGKSTIGWGFTKWTGITKVRDIHHADELFRDIITGIYEDVNKEFPNLSYLQKAALVSLTYNTGPKIRKSELYKRLKADDVKGAIRELGRWIHVRERGKMVVSRGLVRRRKFETKLLSDAFSEKDYQTLKREVQGIYSKQSKL